MKSFSLKKSESYRVMSIKPPYAWAIIYAGKDVENRRARTKHTGPLLIHSSATKLSAAKRQSVREELAELTGWPLSKIPTDFAPSSIIGVVDVVGCVDDSPSKWAADDHMHWLLRNPRPLDKPIANVKGMVPMWTWPRK